MSNGNSLNVVLYDRKVGDLERSKDGLHFVYDRQWLSDAREGRGHALSLSMPLTKVEHGPEVVEPFIAGLLPESHHHRHRIAQAFGMQSAHESDFEFLRLIGRDCAGAVIFADPAERNIALREPPGFKVLSEEELAQLLRELPARPLVDDPVLGTRISLAGVHDKMAVLVMGGKVALPVNGFPSSHIIKVDIAGLNDSIKTEHFCLRLAHACGLRVPTSQIQQAEDKVYMRIARYDRTLQTRQDGPALLNRTHQEDFCQALGIHPLNKYEEKGGPSWKRMAELMKLMERPAVDQAGMLDRALFQYLSGNPDAHGKNYSIRYSPSGRLSLSPVYDLNNQAAFAANYTSMKPLLAMSVGRDKDNPKQGEFWRTRISRDHWAEFAQDVGMPATHVLKRLDEMALKISSAVVSVREEMRHTLADTPLLDVIVDDVVARATAIRENRPEPTREIHADHGRGRGPIISPSL
ncbi:MULTISPECIES: type II toxin-antitoxin system HipA family toxin [Hyphomicrobiales]|uniref:type II toxin-antitoxin system HipA family toxin n=2 Tax=Hyphomicrobiales TaxID=356 RepID=UPI000F68E08F|nr:MULTISPECIES: type II toxin-antitoxin system HipA family toxin [Agrobacterium]MDH1270278.1 type II toxin-antitoxin system HipA family toxin [Agrobacterium pusense]RSC21573.1 type II toxin-antitoxin system HipA family toxin [Agrobacterium sp. FDAARGOS_525]RSC24774.1 type II toxin-antitoxin system HipA family toxin [Agrobacterium sp. FDAARGOS_525]